MEKGSAGSLLVCCPRHVGNTGGPQDKIAAKVKVSKSKTKVRMKTKHASHQTAGADRKIKKGRWHSVTVLLLIEKS